MLKLPITLCLAALALAGAAWGSDTDPALREMQRNLELRRQQQDDLRLRMRQYERSIQAPPADARQQQAIRQLEIEQRQRLQELHYRQSVEAPSAPPAEDEGTRRAKAQIEQQRAQQQSEQQLRRFDRELEEAGRHRTERGDAGR